MENSSIPARASPHLPALSEGARLASLNATTGLDGSVYVEVYVTPIIKLLWYVYRQCRVGAAHENDAKVPTIRRYLRRLASEARGHETKKKRFAISLPSAQCAFLACFRIEEERIGFAGPRRGVGSQLQSRILHSRRAFVTPGREAPRLRQRELTASCKKAPGAL